MNLYDLALTVPWCITVEALEAMLSIAAREPLPRDEIARRMHGPTSLALRGGQKRDDSGRMTMRGNVAVIPIDGPIYRYADMFTAMSGGVTTDALARDLQQALDDPAVRAILFVVDSPGGEATGIGELGDAIYAARSQKPIGAYIEGYGASAAYWLASAAEVVGVDASALVGSIGTVLGVSDPTKRPSTRIDFVSRQSPKKRPDPTTEAGKAVLQQLVDDLTEVFVGAVARNRSLTPEEVVALEGGMVVGQQAIDAGLVDLVTSEEAMVRAMGERAEARATAVRPRPRMQQKGTTMDWKAFWAGMFGAAKEQGIAVEAPEQAEIQPRELAAGEVLQAAAPPAGMQIAAGTQADGTPTPPAAQAPDPRIAELTQQIEALRASERQMAAEAWADAQIRAGKAVPAERTQMVALHSQAAALSDGGALLASVEAVYAERSPHALTSELLPVESAAAANLLPLDRTGDAAARERAEALTLLTTTPLGRAVLAKQQKAPEN